MRTATAKDLRQRTAALLEEVRRGQEVIITYRGKSVAILAPMEKSNRSNLNPIGFGMWQDRKDMRSVKKWLKDLRAPRHKK